MTDSMQQRKEALLKEHKSARKELRKKCNAALQGVKDADERRRIEASNKASQDEQKQQHEQELNALMAELELNEGDEAAPVKKSTKAQRRRQNKEKKEQEQDKEREQLKESGGPSSRDIEIDMINNKLAPLGLTIKPVASDGHCMYRAIADQLVTHTEGSHESITSANSPHLLLRAMCVEMLRMRRPEFEPFMALGDETFESYCDKVGNTTQWGGQLELRALAQALQETIVVVNATGENVVMGEEFRSSGRDRALYLSFHQHYFSLGEHYNSTQSLDDADK